MVDETTGGTGGTTDRDAASNPPHNADTPAPVSQPSAAPEGQLGADMAKILKDIQLPERREAPLTGEKMPRKEVKDIDALLQASAPVAEAPPAPQQPAEPPPVFTQPAEKTSVQSVHTLKHDLQNVVQEQKISVVRAVALEEDRRAMNAQVPTEAPHSNRVKNVFFASALLLFLGAAAFGGVYAVMQSRADKLPEPASDSLVFAERTVTLVLDGQSPVQIKSLLESARTSSNASLGTISRIVPLRLGAEGQPRPATLAEFFAAIAARPPDQLSRALSNDFFFGLHTIDKNAPLLVIPVVSYDNAFAGMLAWEERLNSELAPIYVPVPALMPGADGIPARRVFTDDVMRNYDVRALKDDAGAIVLYYTFPTRGLLVIAESPYTFTELLSRLQAQRNL